MSSPNTETGRIRKLWPGEIDEFHAHLLRLDRQSRQMRFCAAVNDAFIERYCEIVRRVPTLIHGFFAEGDLRAAAELRPILDEWPVAAEVAFTVESPWQDSGIGTALMDRTLTSARNRNIGVLYMICLSENGRMQRIARKFDARLQFENGEVTGNLDPATPDCFSLLREGLDDGAGFVTAIIENTCKAMR